MLLLFCCITQLAWCTWFSSSLILKPLPVLFCLCRDVASAKVSLPPTCSPGPRVPMSLAGAVFQAASHSPRRPRHAGVSASPCCSDCCGLHHAAKDNRSRPWLRGRSCPESIRLIGLSGQFQALLEHRLLCRYWTLLNPGGLRRGMHHVIWNLLHMMAFSQASTGTPFLDAFRGIGAFQALRNWCYPCSSSLETWDPA